MSTRLDTGNYSTTPQPIRASTAADYWQQEGYLLSDSVVAPWDVDANINQKAAGETPAPVLGAFVIANSPVPGPHVVPAAKMPVFQGIPIQTGFVSAASNASGVVLRVGAIRFADAATATRALDALSDPATAPSGAPTGTEVLVESTLDGKHWLTLGTTRANMLLVSSTSAPSQSRTTDALLTKALSMQVDKIAAYKQSPIDTITNTADVPLDTGDRIMEYTLRADEGPTEALSGLSSGVGYLDGYMTPRTLALTTVAAKVGIESQSTNYNWELYANRSGITTIRYKDVDSAKRYYNDRFGNSKEPVQGIPMSTARCGKTDSDRYLCAAWVGTRYVSTTTSKTLLKAKQQIAAQYLLLKQRPT